MATITMLRAKVHRATVTEADVHYIGSLTLDLDLMEAAGLYSYERIEVADVNNGSRLATYVIPGERGSGVVCMNGAAALRIGVGDLVIIFAYTDLEEKEIPHHRPKLVFVDKDNKITSIKEEVLAGERWES